MCAWICLFLQERRAIEVDGFELPVMSEALHAAVEHTDKLGELFEQVHSSRDTVRSRVRASCSSRCARPHVLARAQCIMHMHNVHAHVRMLDVCAVCIGAMSIICVRP